MRASGHEVVVAQTVQERIDTIARIQLAEVLVNLFPQDRAVVGGQAFLRSGTRLQPGDQFLLLLIGELGFGPRLLFGMQARKSPLAIAAYPGIHELPRTAHDGGDVFPFQFRLLAQPLPRQKHHAQAIALLGFALHGD
jgi:hypothetical protein